MLKHQDPIDVHTGIFSPHIVVIPEISAFLDEGYAAAYPHSVRMSTLDSAVLLYSIILVCFAVLYHSLEHKMDIGKNYEPEMPVTHELLVGDLLIFDVLFWVNNGMVVGLFLYMTTAVARPEQFVALALNYVFALYVATSVNAPSTLRMPAVAMWLACVVACKAVSSTGLFTGFLFILSDVFSAIFAYICVCEDGTTLLKYLNVRFWTAILQNGCLVFGYLSSVVFLVPPVPSYYTPQQVHGALTN